MDKNDGVSETFLVFEDERVRISDLTSDEVDVSMDVDPSFAAELMSGSSSSTGATSYLAQALIFCFWFPARMVLSVLTAEHCVVDLSPGFGLMDSQPKPTQSQNEKPQTDGENGDTPNPDLPKPKPKAKKKASKDSTSARVVC